MSDAGACNDGAMACGGRAVVATAAVVVGRCGEPGSRGGMDGSGEGGGGAESVTMRGIYPELASALEQRRGEFDRIGSERRAALDRLAAFVRERQQEAAGARLVFVCTHNSRRSHLSQLWAAAAARANGVKVTAYSGGTETTAFNPRAVAAAERAGFRIEKTTEDENPIYHAQYAQGAAALTCFSKVHDQAPNPKTGYGVVMVCDQADEACPRVGGAAARFALPFEDPKKADGTAEEKTAYDERCAQIAREMAYVMERAARE